MTSKLQDKSLDLAIALTEGLVAGISKGQDWYKIVGTYVDAPLCKIDDQLRHANAILMIYNNQAGPYLLARNPSTIQSTHSTKQM